MLSTRLATCSPVLALIAAASFGTPAMAGEPPAKGPAGTSRGTDQTPLAGPSVAPERKAPTLVERDFAGRVVKLDVQPAEAAVRLLDLDEATQAKVDAILLERSRILDALVLENLQLLSELQSARAVGDREAAAQIYGQLAARATPLRERGQLAQELMEELTPRETQELRRLMQEYWQAVVEEELRDKQAAREGDMDPAAADRRNERRARRADAREALREEMLDIVGGEIRRAYERTIVSAAREFDTLLKDLNVSPEQEARIRGIVGDSFQATLGRATVQERTRVFAEVFQLLDEGQKAEVLRRLGPHPRLSREQR